MNDETPENMVDQNESYDNLSELVEMYVKESFKELMDEATQPQEMELEGGVMPVTVQVPSHVSVDHVIDMLFEAENKGIPTEFVIHRSVSDE